MQCARHDLTDDSRDQQGDAAAVLQLPGELIAKGQGAACGVVAKKAPTDQGSAQDASVSLETVRKHLSCQLCHEIVASALVMHCSHIFCGECLYQHLNVKASCPTCQVGPLRAIPVRCLALDGVAAAFVSATQDLQMQARWATKTQQGEAAANKLNKMYWWLQSPMAVGAPDAMQPPIHGGCLPPSHHGMHAKPAHSRLQRGMEHGGPRMGDVVPSSRRNSDSVMPAVPRPHHGHPMGRRSFSSSDGGAKQPYQPHQPNSTAHHAAALFNAAQLAQQHALLQAQYAYPSQYSAPQQGSQYGMLPGSLAPQNPVMPSGMTQLQEQMMVQQLLQQVSLGGWPHQG